MIHRGWGRVGRFGRQNNPSPGRMRGFRRRIGPGRHLPGSTSLGDVQPHSEAIIQTLPCCPSLRSQAISQGLLPGSRIMMIENRHGGTRLVQSGDSLLALSQELVQAIGVTPLGMKPDHNHHS